MTREDLIAFEADMAALFEAGEIRAPLHLAGGNEDQLIEIFQGVRSDDWALCSWRSHYHCLLKGVPQGIVREAIKRGRSIALCFPAHRILSSAIVGGTAPIAVGLGMAIKREGGSERVWCFLGDMTAETGIVHEAMKYAAGHDLPINWIIEDNGKSVCSDTRETWGKNKVTYTDRTRRYRHELSWPHVGVGKWVAF